MLQWLDCLEIDVYGLAPPSNLLFVLATPLSQNTLAAMHFASRLPLTVVLIAGLLVAIQPAQADTTPHDQLKKHVRDIVQKVKAASSPAEKRSILDEELRDMLAALDRIEQMASLSERDQTGIDALRSLLQEKLDELHGQNGYEAVPDRQLDSFADYVQQDFEQADRVVTISLTSALLILLIIILVV